MPGFQDPGQAGAAVRLMHARIYIQKAHAQLTTTATGTHGDGAVQNAGSPTCLNHHAMLYQAVSGLAAGAATRLLLMIHAPIQQTQTTRLHAMQLQAANGIALDGATQLALQEAGQQQEAVLALAE